MRTARDRYAARCRLWRLAGTLEIGDAVDEARRARAAANAHAGAEARGEFRDDAALHAAIERAEGIVASWATHEETP